jgi:hypothetical protein
MKRNLVNFTRGSQLLGHFSFMFAAGLKGPLIVAALVISWTSWWTISAGLTDHEVYLVWMRIYAAIYGFMEFDPAKRITLETAFGATIQFPIAQLESYPPVVHAWEKLTGLLTSALWRSGVLLGARLCRLLLVRRAVRRPLQGAQTRARRDAGHASRTRRRTDRAQPARAHP